METLKKLRMQSGATQQKMAEYLGISRPTYTRYENGEREPDNNTLKKLADYFNVSVDFILGRSDIKQTPEKHDFLRIPVYGCIPAGIPMEAIENIDGYEDIPINWSVGEKEFFALRIHGDSMFPEYRNNDIVIFKKQETCESGEDCAVLINGCDATFKRVDRHENGIILKPLNTAYESRYYSNRDIETIPIRIIGVFQELRRSRP